MAREAENCRRRVHLCSSWSNNVSQSIILRQCCLGQSLSFAGNSFVLLLLLLFHCLIRLRIHVSGGGGWGGRWSRRRACDNCIGARRHKEDGAQHPPPAVRDPRFFVYPRPQHQLVPLHTVHSSSYYPATPSFPFHQSLPPQHRNSNCALLHPPMEHHVLIPNDTQTTFILIQASKSPYRANPEIVKYSGC